MTLYWVVMNIKYPDGRFEVCYTCSHTRGRLAELHLEWKIAMIVAGATIKSTCIYAKES